MGQIFFNNYYVALDATPSQENGLYTNQVLFGAINQNGLTMQQSSSTPAPTPAVIPDPVVTPTTPTVIPVTPNQPVPVNPGTDGQESLGYVIVISASVLLVLVACTIGISCVICKRREAKIRQEFLEKLREAEIRFQLERKGTNSHEKSTADTDHLTMRTKDEERGRLVSDTSMLTDFNPHGIN